MAGKRQIYLYASYIASSDNIEADTLSRIRNEDTVWEPNYKYFEGIVNEFGATSIDLFTTRYNTKCKKFFSWAPDPAAAQVDAFTVQCNKLKFYAFPPFCLILQVLTKPHEKKLPGSSLYQIGQTNHGTRYTLTYLSTSLLNITQIKIYYYLLTANKHILKRIT